METQDPLTQFILGLLQGVAEFLPISSSGHLTIAENFFGISEGHIALNLALHGATLAVIAFFYRARLVKLFFPLDLAYLLAIFVASVPTAGLGLLIKKNEKLLFGDSHWSAIFLCINGLWLLSLGFYLQKKSAQKGALGQDLKDALKPNATSKELNEQEPASKELNEQEPAPTLRQALIIGLAQGVAALPGISRSGATIGVARILGVSAKSSVEFSLLVSIPAIGGAGLLELFHAFGEKGVLSPSWGLLLGVATALLSGYFSIQLLLKIAKSDAWRGWGLYCLGVGLLVLGLYCKS